MRALAVVAVLFGTSFAAFSAVSDNCNADLSSEKISLSEVIAIKYMEVDIMRKLRFRARKFSDSDFARLEAQVKSLKVRLAIDQVEKTANGVVVDFWIQGRGPEILKALPRLEVLKSITWMKYVRDNSVPGPVYVEAPLW